jgi:DNA-binding NarL/FixJ family response regulator
MSQPRVLVCEDHPVFRDGLVTALRDNGLDVVAEVGDGEAALEAAAVLGPDVVIMDLVLPGISGVDATQRLLEADPELAVLALTMSADDASVFAVLRSGARGYLLKEASASEIADAVRAVARGHAVLGRSVSQRVLSAAAEGAPADAGPLGSLTPRERQVLGLVARGLDNVTIARQLGLSDKTVRNSVSLLMSKIGVRSRAEAVAKARDAGLGTSRS